MADGNHKRSRPSFEEAWRQRFIKFSASDDDAGIAGWSATGLEARFRHFARVWPGDTEGAFWLDVGCGAGTYSRYLKRHGIKVIGMDYSHPTVLKASARANHDGTWAAGDVTRLPIRAECFDGVLCFGVMQALERPEPALEELMRVVKPGGQIWIDALNSWCLPSLWERMVRRVQGRPMHLRYDSPGHLRRLMTAAGCKGVQAYWVPILPVSMQRYQRFLEGPLARRLIRYFPVAGALLSHAIVLQGKRSAAC